MLLFISIFLAIRLALLIISFEFKLILPLAWILLLLVKFLLLEITIFPTDKMFPLFVILPIFKVLFPLECNNPLFIKLFAVMLLLALARILVLLVKLFVIIVIFFPSNSLLLISLEFIVISLFD